MKIEALNKIPFHPESKSIELMDNTKPSFSSWLKENVSATNEQLLAADQSLVELASGQSASLHQTMLTLEQAKLSFQFLEQIRNRLMAAYQELMKEQI